MATSDVILLDQIIEQTKKDQAPDSEDDDFFELFVAQNLLKQEALSNDEFEAGLLGSRADGGMDAAYFFVDGRLIREDTDADEFKKRPIFEIYIIQAKREKTFGEKTFDKFISSSGNLFDFSRDLDEFEKLYNPDVISVFRSFRELFLSLASRHPSLSIRYRYVCKGNTSEISESVTLRVNELRSVVSKHFADAEFNFEFLGAAELLRLARQRPPQTLTLPFSEILSADAGGYVALTKLSDYNNFLRNEEGLRHGHIFDENVRAYQGNIEVNKAIREALETPTGEDFWQLNNGITILTQEASTVGKTINISDPQIINGLQTSTEILSFFDNPDVVEKNRHVLIKVVKTDSAATRDRVIKATNSQTGVLPSSLRATDPIQRDIEEAIAKNSLFYDRQKNYYRNEGKPRARIIGIAEMAQSTMSMLLQRPNDARARPSNLIRDDKDYAKLFNSEYQIKIYSVIGECKKHVDWWLKNKSGLASADRNNTVFHVLTRLTVLLTGKPSPNADDIAQLTIDAHIFDKIEQAFKEVHAIYVELGSNATVAKGKPFVDRILSLE